MSRFLKIMLFILVPAFSANFTFAAPPLLIFSVDQASPMGPVQNGDMAGLERVLDSLNVNSDKYRICVLLSGNYADKSKMNVALDLIASRHMPFIIDVYSSDIMMIQWGTRPFDISHGQALSTEDLKLYKQKYGDIFVGIRIFETMAQSFAIEAARQGGGRFVGQDWIGRVKAIMPKDHFFEEPILNSYFAFANSNKMFVIFSDWYWPNDPANAVDAPALRQPENLQVLQDALRRYPGVAYVMYANNQPGGTARKVSDAWFDLIKEAGKGAQGFGLSDQSWLCTGGTYPDIACPVETMIAWANDALGHDVAMIETEPYWYWWNFPRGTPKPTGNYWDQEGSASFGTPRENLRKFLAAIGHP